MKKEKVIQVLEDLRFQFEDRIAEAETCREFDDADTDVTEALQSNKEAYEALTVAIKAVKAQPVKRRGDRL